MTSEKRRLTILQRLEEEGELDIKQLAAEWRLAEVTIRRDMKELARNGLIHRTHGGAMSVTKVVPRFSFANKAEVHSAAKKAICERAAREVTDAEIVFMDCGSTVFHLCPLIGHIRTKVITNSLPVIYALQDSNVELNIIGGELDAARQAVHGKMAEQHIRQYHATIAFLGVDAI